MSSFSRRHFVVTLSATCVGRGVLAGVSDAASLTPVTIEVPSRDNLQFLALWVAVGSGAFERQSLAPQIVAAPSPRQTGDMLLHGTANVALLPPPMFLGMMAENKPIRLFASLLANEPINLVLSRQIAEQRKFTPSAPRGLFAGRAEKPGNLDRRYPARSRHLPGPSLRSGLLGGQGRGFCRQQLCECSADRKVISGVFSRCSTEGKT